MRERFCFFFILSFAEAMQVGNRAFAQFKYYKLWPCKITRVIPVKDDGSNYEVCCYGTDEIKIVTSENIWAYAEKYEEALRDGRKNVQRAIRLCTEDSEGLAGDLSESVNLMQSEIVNLRDGIQDEIRRRVEEQCSRLGSSPVTQIKSDFLDTVTQAVYEAIDLQFKGKFELLEKSLGDLRARIVQNCAKLQKLETKLDDINQSSLLTKVIVSGIDSPARDLPHLGEKVLARLNSEMGLNLDKSVVKGARRLGGASEIKTPIELTFFTEASAVEILRNRKNLKGTRIYVNEALTRERQEIYKLARNKFELKNVWTLRGVVYVKCGSQIIPCKTISDVVQIRNVSYEPVV